MRRWPDRGVPFFAGADMGVSSASDGASLGVFGLFEFDGVGSDRSATAVCSLRVCNSASPCVPFHGCGVLVCLGLWTSMIESVLRCGGVGVSGVVGEVGFDAVGVVSCPFVHASSLMGLGDGEPVVSDALAMRSSDDRFVCENSLGDIIVLRLDMPRPSIFAAAAVVCRSILSGSVVVADGMSKSSRDSVVLPCSCAPLTTRASALDDAAGPFHSGCGSRPMMFSRPVPALAHCQIPRRGGEWCADPLVALLPFSTSASLGCRGRDASSELGRRSSRTGSGFAASASSAPRVSGVMTLLSFAQSWVVSGLGGWLARAVSVEVPTVDDAGLVRRRRRRASPELPGRVWRGRGGGGIVGGGGGAVAGGGGRGGRGGGAELVEAVDLAEDWLAFGALALRAG